MKGVNPLNPARCVPHNVDTTAVELQRCSSLIDKMAGPTPNNEDSSLGVQRRLWFVGVRLGSPVNSHDPYPEGTSSRLAGYIKLGQFGVQPGSEARCVRTGGRRLGGARFSMAGDQKTRWWVPRRVAARASVWPGASTPRLGNSSLKCGAGACGGAGGRTVRSSRIPGGKASPQPLVRGDGGGKIADLPFLRGATRIPHVTEV